MRKIGLTALTALLATLIATAWTLGQTAKPSWPALSPATRQSAQSSLDKGLAYLRQNQKADGSWESHEGITGLAALAFLKQPGGWKKDDAYVSKGLKYISTLAKPDGSIFSKDMPAVNTAIAIMAFKLSGKPEYANLVKKGQDYLVKAQFDEGEGFKPSDKNFGGIGYDDESRADLSNLHHVLEALKETSLPNESPVWDKAIKFIQRTQNRKASNDQGWAADDGGFIYMPGMSFSGGTKSYGSMTYAGLLSYSYANLKKTDQRVGDAYKWIRTNYTVDENPGLGKTTLYYYYMVFAKGLRVIGEPIVTDAKGQKHDWRDDLAKKIVSLQNPQGYWVNLDDPSHWQDNKALVTAFTATALDYVLNDTLQY
jgi:squalene-hopene/tetraprenyl-beta-curcumene cyclase